MTMRIIELSLCLAAALALGYAEAATTSYAGVQDAADRDAVSSSTAAYRCEFGKNGRGRASAAESCATAHLDALKERRFDDALRYASIGCRKHGLAVSCRQAGRVPLEMGNSDVPVPRAYAQTIRAIATHVCQSGAVIWHPFGGKVTGQECSALARHFVLAADDDYRFALQPAAREYFESTYDARFAEALYTAACKRWRNRDACEQRPLIAALARADDGGTKRPSGQLVQFRRGFENWNAGEPADRVACVATDSRPEMICSGGLCRATSPEADACLAQARTTSALSHARSVEPGPVAQRRPEPALK